MWLFSQFNRPRLNLNIGHFGWFNRPRLNLNIWHVQIPLHKFKLVQAIWTVQTAGSIVRLSAHDEVCKIEPAKTLSYVFLTPDSCSFSNLYSILSTRACQLASIRFSDTPTVFQTPSLSCDSMITRTLAAVPFRGFITRTL